MTDATTRATITANFDQVEAEVRNTDATLVAVSMERLRNAIERRKLGKYVCEDISAELRNRGLGHYPEMLPPDAWEDVYVFAQGSDVERILRAADDPSEENADRLRAAAQPAASEKVLRQIQELLEG